jgi:hypothetical protein
MNQQIIKSLQHNMISLKNINNFCKNIYINNKNSNKNSISTDNNFTSKTKEKTISVILKKDTLFWCFYILKHGYSNYEINIENNAFSLEKQEKYKYISILRNNKELLKNYKIKPLCDIEDELSNKEQISIKTFVSLCLVEGINILVVNNNRTYFELLVEPSKNINIICKENEKYYIEENESKKEDYYKNNYLLIDHYEFKLKSISAYKLDDLLNICNKLGIHIIRDNNKKMTKKEMYEKIVMFFR